MPRFPIPLLLVAAVACSDPPTAPLDAPRVPSFDVVAAEETGPPPRREFGPDSYRVGLFTGQGTTRPGLDCDGSTAAGRTCSGFLASDVDGTLLDVTVSVPAGSGPHPLVALIHGYAGSKTSSGDIARRLNESGYAVLRYSTRGFGKSWGQVNMSDVHAEIADLRSMIAQVLDRGNLHLNADRVAITGASYGGGHSWLALLEPTFATPKGRTVNIRTVVPIAPWTDLLYSLIPNGRPRESVDIPGGLKFTYVNGLYASGFREPTSERPYSNYPDYFIAWHAWMNVAEPTAIDPVYRQISDGLAGYRSIWWRDDFWTTIASKRIPIFQVQGFTDDLFPLPEAKRMLLALKTLDPSYPIATYLGDLGHPRATNRPAEMDYVLGLIQQWLGYYLKDEGALPPAVIYANITRPRGTPFSTGDIITVNTWQELATRSDTTYLDGEKLLINPATDPSGFEWDPFVMIAAGELRPYTDVPPAWPEIETSLANWEIGVSEIANGSAVLIAGQPVVELHASTLSHRVQLDVRLIDIAPDGTRELITRGTYTLDSGIPGVPIGETAVKIQTYGNLWSADPSHRLRLEISNIDSPYITPSRVPSATIVSGVSLIIPVR